MVAGCTGAIGPVRLCSRICFWVSCRFRWNCIKSARVCWTCCSRATSGALERLSWRSMAWTILSPPYANEPGLVRNKAPIDIDCGAVGRFRQGEHLVRIRCVMRALIETVCQSPDICSLPLALVVAGHDLGVREVAENGIGRSGVKNFFLVQMKTNIFPPPEIFAIIRHK